MSTLDYSAEYRSRPREARHGHGQWETGQDAATGSDLMSLIWSKHSRDAADRYPHLLVTQRLPEARDLAKAFAADPWVLKAREAERQVAQDQRAYAVRFLVLSNVVLNLGIVWGTLTGISMVREEFWLAPSAALFGCLGIAWVGVSLIIAGNSRRASPHR